jgi:hypothetical protein
LQQRTEIDGDVMLMPYVPQYSIQTNIKEYLISGARFIKELMRKTKLLLSIIQIFESEFNLFEKESREIALYANEF